jgi:hypothetical protein
VDVSFLEKALLLGMVAGASCWAAPIPITNPSFESPTLTLLGLSDSATGWTLSGVAKVYFPPVGADNGTNLFAAVPDGNQILLDLNLASDANQALGISLTANTTYTLTYFVGRRYDLPIGGYTVAVKAGSTVLVSDSGGAPGAGAFVQRTLTFATGATPLSGILSIDITSTGLSATGGLAETAFDMITLTSTSSSPEPASMLLFGGGFLGLTFMGRKRLLRR